MVRSLTTNISIVLQIGDYPGSTARGAGDPALLLVVALLIIALVIVWWQRRDFKTKLADAESKRSLLTEKLAEQEMQLLRSQMNPHFIFNSLNSINRYIVKSDPETASAYLTKFGKLMRLILENSNHKLISLEQELHALRLYIELESLRFNRKFSYTIDIDEKIPASTFGLPPLILQPFIENAIWHGLLHKETPGILKIEVRRSGAGIVCVIEDNGIGRKKAAELKSKSINAEKSFGLKITSARIKRINGHSNFRVEDLSDALGNAAGTRVTLEIAPGEVEEY